MEGKDVLIKLLVVALCSRTEKRKIILDMYNMSRRVW